MKHNYKATHKRLSTMTGWRAGMTVEESETVLHALDNAPQWLSIETAPKSGNCVLGIDSQGKVHVMRYIGFWGVYEHDYLHFDFKPTHWMPLPSPPEAHDE